MWILHIACQADSPDVTINARNAACFFRIMLWKMKELDQKQQSVLIGQSLAKGAACHLNDGEMMLLFLGSIFLSGLLFSTYS